MIQKKHSSLPLGALVFLYVLMVVGLFWDDWWHVFMGRDSFFIPPHDLLYLSLLGVGAIALVLYKKHPALRPRLRWMIGGLVITLLAGPFDEWWHDRYGIEDLSSPFIVWSPPHLMGLLGGLISAWFAFLFVRAHDKHPFPWLALTQLAALLGVLWFIVHPVDPIGLYATFFTPWAEVLFVFPFIYCLGVARRMAPGGAWFVAAVFLALYSITWTEQSGANIILPPHPVAPLWAYAFAIGASALLIERLWRLGRQRLLGAITGYIFVVLHVLLPQPFIINALSLDETSVAIFLTAGIIAGISAMACAQKTRVIITDTRG
ncbi:MAG: hypothetical protein AAB579_04120 [Patescibacteria group bacterium]